MGNTGLEVQPHSCVLRQGFRHVNNSFYSHIRQGFAIFGDDVTQKRLLLNKL